MPYQQPPPSMFSHCSYYVWCGFPLPNVPSALSALWVRAGTAIRMVNCLFVSCLTHYVNSSRHRPRILVASCRVVKQNIEFRRTPVGGLRDQRSVVRLPIKIGERAGAHEPTPIQDSLIYGHPYMIDVVDCDARLRHPAIRMICTWTNFCD